ncbi:MAG: hypothetical protein KBS84_06695 [Treponema sp.]|nr:hypothetical protein [Candidatus Treponema scatequi]
MKKLLLIFTLFLIALCCYSDNKSVQKPKTIVSRQEAKKIADAIYDIAW